MKLLFTLFITLLLMVGCGASKGIAPIIEKAPQTVVKQQSKLPTPPKKTFKAKKVEDTNLSDQYMYPEDGAAAVKDSKEQKSIVNASNTSSAMTKGECISMISQEKFDKYSAMFGSEAASLKRCTMLKAMNH